MTHKKTTKKNKKKKKKKPKAPSVMMMESIPPSFQKALAEVRQREKKAQRFGKAALLHAKSDLHKKLGASKAQAREVMLQARRDTMHAAVVAESHAKWALDHAKAKLAALQQVPHEAPLLRMPPVPAHVESFDSHGPTRLVEPVPANVAARQIIEGDVNVNDITEAPQPSSSYNSKAHADFEAVLSHPGEHFRS
jgi:hypothetical protein